MSRGYWFPPILAVLVAAPSVACSPKFTACDDPGRTCAANAEQAGSTGAGQSNHDGGSGGNRTPTGEAGSSGEAGSGGEAGAFDESPTLSGACSLKGAFACAQLASAERLACDGKQWQVGTGCASGQLCDSSNGSCAPVIPECASAAPGAAVCRGDQILACGRDLVSASEGETCAGRCKLGVCKPPTCGDEKVQAGEDCDNDGKRNPGDGCSATCRAEPVALALGGQTTCALSSTGLVKCWGFNGTGELGLGHTSNRGDVIVPRQLTAVDLGVGRKATAITVSDNGSVCAVLEGGDLKCWGNNQFGQLGTGDVMNRGDRPGQMGDALRPIALGAGRKALNVSAGSDYTCAVLDDGSVKCWGYNGFGRLGTELAANLHAPDPVVTVKLGRKAKTVSASADGVTCALLDDGTLKCWGNIWVTTHADHAELGGDPGIGDFTGEITGLPALTFSGGFAAESLVAGRVYAVVLSDRSLRLWGTAAIGQLGQPGVTYLGLTPTDLAAVAPLEIGNGRSAKSIALGATHACALLNGGQVKCWGGNAEGQLGLGNTDTIDRTPQETEPVYLGGHSALQVATGQSHSCAILDDASVKCWGLNSAGQLGLGDTQNRGDSGGKLSANTTVDLVF